MRHLVKVFLADERGDTVIEYVMIAMMAGIIAFSFVTSLVAAFS